ncbi:MAG: hypothetical protein EP338_04030 [Bacteroidetes bacterium]|nr:MAG: hypothetical protein EP338_04030 [Bacteroidota bacterium]
MKSVKTVDDFYDRQSIWKDQLDQLRHILQSTELEETLKWGMPTYCLNGKNVCGLGAFKQHYGIWFFQGVFLSDPNGKLSNAQEQTQAMRQWKFTADDSIDEHLVRQYVLEAIENQRKGLVHSPKKIDPKQHIIPEDLAKNLKENPAAQKHFEDFAPSAQREYVEWLTEAKTEATRNKRLQTAIEWISEGKPRNWKYMKKWK